MRSSRLIYALLAVGLSGCLSAAAAGCGSSSTATSRATAAHASNTSTTASTASTAPSTFTRAQAALAYLRAVQPAKAAGDAFDNQINNNTTASEAAPLAKPVITAFGQTNIHLLTVAQHYPEAAVDIKALIDADSGVIADLAGLSSVTLLDQSSWVQSFLQDGEKTKAASSIVRSDLGLPQVNS